MKLKTLLLAAGAVSSVVLGAYGAPLAIGVPEFHSSEKVQTWIDAVTLVAPLVAVADGDIDDPATFGGSTPGATQDIYIPEGITVTVDTNYTVDFVYVDGTLHVKAPPFAGGLTVFTTDTVMHSRTARIIIDEQAGGKVTCQTKTETNINLARDPHMITRGWVGCGKIDLLGKPRQTMIPISNDLIAGLTTRAYLTVSPFLGMNGPAGSPNDPFNYTLLPFDWEPGERGVILGRHPRVNVLDARSGETVEFQALHKVSNPTAFSNFDTTGSYIDFTAPVTLTNTEYFDTAASAYSRTNFGPPDGAPTAGSHGNWAHRPWLVNPNRNIKFTCTDPDAPVHRRPHFMYGSAATRIHYVEFVRWGRTNILQDTVVEGTADALPLAEDTNLRHRDVLHAYDAGFCPFGQIMRGGFSAEIIGVSVWDGGYYLGESQANGAQGDATFSMAFSQYGSAVYYEACFGHNTIGATYKVYSAQNLAVHRHCIGSQAWGESPNGTPVFFKDHDHYTRGDTGRGGEIFSYDARTVSNVRCSVHDSHFGMVALTRSPDEEDKILPAIYMPEGPESIGMHQYANGVDDDRPIIHIEGFYAAATTSHALIVSKNGPAQGHGDRTHVLDCIYDSCLGGGAWFEYTGFYIVQGMVDLGPDTGGAPAGQSLRLGTSNWNFVCLNHFYANRAEGVDDRKQDASGTPLVVKNYFVNFHTPMNVTTPWINVNLANEYRDIDPATFSSNFGAKITSIEYQSSSQVRIRGKVRDALSIAFGEPDYDLLLQGLPDDSDGLKVDVAGSHGAISVYGYWTNTDEGVQTFPPTPFSGVPPRFSKYPLTITSRVPNGQRLQHLKTLAPLMMIGNVPGQGSNTWKHPSGVRMPYVNNGNASWAAAIAASNAELNPQELVFA